MRRFEGEVLVSVVDLQGRNKLASQVMCVFDCRRAAAKGLGARRRMGFSPELPRPTRTQPNSE